MRKMFSFSFIHLGLKIITFPKKLKQVNVPLRKNWSKARLYVPNNFFGNQPGLASNIYELFQADHKLKVPTKTTQPQIKPFHHHHC